MRSVNPMSRPIFIVIILLIAVVAAVFRLQDLAERPMHGDEAVNAFKLGETLEGRGYEYDPHEYHGPSLNYLALLPAWLGGTRNYVELQESMLRIVPVVFGTLLVLLVLPIGDVLGRVASVFAAMFTAVSPAMVFYSRYFIHEMLLVCFTAGAIVCGYRYLKRPGILWASLVGVCLGMMHATKETFVIALGAMGSALCVMLCARWRVGQWVNDIKRVRPAHCVVMLLAAAAVSVTFFSSFFSNAEGVRDSVLAYTNYFDRAGHTSPHVHPWHYYLGLLSFYQFDNGPVFSEWIVLLLALVGLGFTIRGSFDGDNALLLRFVALYTVLMTVIYSLIPYKTPWCLLSFYHGIILLAGVGVACLFQLKSEFFRCVLGAVLLVGTSHLVWQSNVANNLYNADSRNPYVYAHTGSDIFQIVNRVKEMAQAHEDGQDTPIQIFCPHDDYWPLPWYLRGYRVQYGSEVADESKSAPIVLIQPPLEEALMRKLYELPPPGQKELYMHLFYDDGQVPKMELRPQVEIRGFVAKSLWDRHERAKVEADSTTEGL